MEFIYRENEIALESPEGKTLARVTFPALDAETVEIDHTFVDDSLRGQEWPESFWRLPPQSFGSGA